MVNRNGVVEREIPDEVMDEHGNIFRRVPAEEEGAASPTAPDSESGETLATFFIEVSVKVHRVTAE